MKSLIPIIAIALALSTAACHSSKKATQAQYPHFYFNSGNPAPGTSLQRVIDSDRMADTLPLPSGTFHLYGEYFFREPLKKGTLKKSVRLSHLGSSCQVNIYQFADSERLTPEECAIALTGDTVKALNRRFASEERFKYIMSLIEGKPSWHKPVTLPEFDYEDPSGNHISNSTLLGKPLVINFWESLCGPCLKEMALLNTWPDSFPEVNFIAVTPEDIPHVRKVLSKHKYVWPQLVQDTVFHKWLPDMMYYPCHVVVDQNGYVRMMDYGGTSVTHRRVIDTLRAVMEGGPLSSPRLYKDLHYDEEYSSCK